VNNVCPGFTLTARLEELVEKRAHDAGVSREKILEGMNSQVPIGRVARPDEFAALVVFLASERASSINGSTIAVDGGFVKGLL
jgi:3-oxoacyl-[acyl-carrier protein] reductase